MNNCLEINGLTFRPYLSAAQIAKRIGELAEELKRDGADESTLFVCMLSGAFVFASDLLHAMNTTAEICFVKWSSYCGTQSSGELTEQLPVTADVKGRKVIVVEDIVETGMTMRRFVEKMKAMGAADCKIVSLLHKAQLQTHAVHIDWVGFEIDNAFVVGYGLDYDGKGRMLRDLYAKV